MTSSGFKNLALDLSEGITKWMTVHAGNGTRTVDSFITVLNGGTQTVNLPAASNPFCVLIVLGGATVTINGTAYQSSPVTADSIIFCQRADGAWYVSDNSSIGMIAP